MSNLNPSNNNNEISKNYQLLERKNSTYFSNGFVKLNRKLLADEFVSYHNEETESFVLISNFADQQYECTGSCYCDKDYNEENFSKRRSTTLLSRGLFMLVSAISVTMAIKIAEEAFRDECIQKFKFDDDEDCEEPLIKEKIQACDPLSSEDLAKSREKYYKAEDGKYECVGHCLTSLEPFEVMEAGKLTLGDTNGILPKLGKCEEIEVMGKIERAVPGETFDPIIIKRQFVLHHLWDFCENAYKYTTEIDRLELSLCTASYKGDFSNIQCWKSFSKDMLFET